MNLRHSNPPRYSNPLDNLTHTLTGLMMARAGINRKIPSAGLLMMIAANAPDLDIVSGLGGTATYLNIHRGITHSLIAAPVMAAIAVVIVALIRRRKLPWLSMWLAAIAGVLSHLLLDWTNAYGIRLLLPFSSEWLRLDTVYVVDVAIWAILLLGVAAPALGKLVSSEIGAKPTRGTGWAIFALATLSIYEAGRYVAHERALSILNARIYAGTAPVRVAAFAQSLAPWAWKGVIETSASYVVFYMDLRDDFDPSSGKEFFKAEPSPRIEAAKHTREFDSLVRYSSFPLWKVTAGSDPQSRARVELFDLRFGTPASPGLQASGFVDGSNRVEDPAVKFGPLQSK